MGFLRKFENKMENSVEGMADQLSNAPISPVKIAKQAEKAMKRERMVGAGKQYAPTLYTVLVNPDDDRHLFGYYPTLAGETETYLSAKAHEMGLVMDGQPLVRFIVDGALKHGKFDIIAEAVAAPIVEQLRMEENQRYGLAPATPYPQAAQAQMQVQQAQQAQAADPYGQYGQFNQPDPYGQYGQNAPQYPPQYAGNAGVENPYNPYEYNAQPAASIQQNATAYDANPAQQLIAQPAEQPAEAAPSYADSIAAAANPGVLPAAAVVAAAPAAAAFAAAPETMVMPSAPAAEAAPYARLTDAATGQTYTITQARAVIGRGSTCTCMIPDINASRNHAELRLEPQGFWSVTDLKSTNGTYVNNQRIGSVALRENDCITIGVTNLVFTQH